MKKKAISPVGGVCADEVIEVGGDGCRVSKMAHDVGSPLVGVEDVRTAVTNIPDVVIVLIGLVGVLNIRAVVLRIRHTICIRVSGFNDN